jgi:hypothetical protein
VINDTGQALPTAWILDEDRDIQILREDYPKEWSDVTAQLTAAKPDGASDDGDELDRTSDELPALERYPDWPWPAPVGRARAWGSLALLCIVGVFADAAFSITDMTLPWIVGLLVLIAFCSWRVTLALREARGSARLVIRPKRANGE